MKAYGEAMPCGGVMSDKMPLAGECGKQINYGCLFCVTGREDDVAGYISQQYPHIMALPAAQMKHKSENGRRSHTRHIMLPGYIFLRTEELVMPIGLMRTPGVLRLLYEEDQEWQLRYENLAFAKWVYDCDGLVEISKAYAEGETVRIAEGPLKEKQGSIVKVDKRNRNCLVALRFNGTVFRVWLAFDYIQAVV
jgi:transcriptional antiterminator NusG